MIRNLFSVIPFVLLNLRAPDAGAPAGGGGSTVTAPAEPETGATLEQQVSHWKKAATDFFKQLSGAFTEKDNEISAHTATKGQLKTEQDAHTATKGELKTEQDAHTATKGEISTAKTTIAGLTTERDKATTNVTRLEGLCDARGIDHKEVVAPQAGGPVVTGAVQTVDDWNAKLASAKTPEAQHQILTEFQKACADGKVKKSA